MREDLKDSPGANFCPVQSTASKWERESETWGYFFGANFD